MFVSVVIPTYNRRPILEKCLDAVERQRFEGGLDQYEVVVVDDGSTDGTPAWLREEVGRFPHVRLVEQQHGGPAEGRNRGVDHAKGDVIVFIDSDLVVTESFLACHAKALHGCCCRFQVTVKTHQPRGKLSVRPIHSATGLAFNGLSSLRCSAPLL